MATGSGKTLAAITAIYRLIKYGGARRVLFLVDRTNLGEQAEKEFQGYRAPDSHRQFTELYNVQRLSSNTIMDSSRVVISTIQRVYSMLKGEPDLDPAVEEVLAVRDQRRGDEGAAAGRLQRRLPAGVLRRRRHRRGATARSTRSGGRWSSTSTPSSSASPRPRRSRRSASSTRTWSWSTTTSARWPTASTWTSRSTTSAPRSPSAAPRSRREPDTMLGYRDRQTRAHALGDAGRGPHLRPERARPPRRRQGPDPHHHPHLPRPPADRHLPRPQGGPEDPDLRQGRQPRRGHRRDRARRVRPRQRLLPEDHLQGHRPRTRAT